MALSAQRELGRCWPTTRKEEREKKKKKRGGSVERGSAKLRREKRALANAEMANYTQVKRPAGQLAAIY